MKIYSMEEYNAQDKKIYSMDEYSELYPKKETVGVPKKNKAGVLKTTGKTILAGTNYLGQGVLKGIEGIGDTLLQVGSSKVNPYYWFNPDKLKEHQAITRDIIKEDATKNLVNTLSGDKNFNENVLDKDSLIKESNLGGAVAKSIGQMLPSIAIGSGMGAGTKLAENVGLGVMGVQSFGGGLEEAYNQGATRGQATSYALMDSAIETATEKMFAGIGGVLGKGALDDAIKTKLTKKMSNAVAKKLTEYGLDMVGEGVEELASDLLQPLAQKLTYANDKELKKLYQDQNYLEDFVAGALSAGVMQGVRLPSDIKTAVKENATKKATQVKLPGTRTEQSISNNIEELKQEQQATTDNKVKQELASEINTLEKQLEKQGTRILEESEAKRQGMINNFKEYLEENNITNPTQQDINDSITDILGYDNELDYTDTLKEEKLYNQYVKEYMKENGIPFNENNSFKQQQLDIINKSNPMKDDYHTGIRNVDDIKTFEEAINDDESFTWGDYTKEDATKDLQKGTVTVYSSYPIENGNFVSTSKNQARDYAGGRKIYSKEVPLTDIAWINGDEGQYAKLDDIKLPTKEVKLPGKTKKTLPTVKEQTNASEIANEINNVTKSRGLVKTLTESDALKGKVLIEDLDPQKINYVVQTNKSSLDKANNTIDTLGYEKSLDKVKQLINDEKLPSASEVALMQRMIQEAAKRGDAETVQDLIMDTAIVGTDLGQATQALSIIQKLTPEGQLKMYTKLVQRAKVRGENSFKDVEITPKMAKNILDAYNSDGTYDQQDLNNRVEQFKQQIANQMKTTIGEKINAWRYLSMLGNPKTHIRNIVSNVAMNGTIKVKNAMARTLESVLPIENRTKTWKQATDYIKNFSEKTANEMKGIITGEAKYNEKTALETKKQIFKNKTLEKISDFNSKALEAEDWFFSKMAFKNTLQEYLTANGINTLEDVKNNPEVVEKAKIYAVEQAEIATFRQYSKLASAINSLEKNNKAARLFIEATMPFKKTPINVAKAGVKYSPLGLIKAISYDIYQVKQGNMEASQFIDNLSQGLTGTSLAMLGYALAKAGILNGAGGDDKDNKYDSQLGDNQYSIKIGDKSYSISWLSPVAMPLLVGANAYEQLEGKEEWDMNVVSDTLAKTLDPLNEMSFMQGLTNALTSYGSGVDKIKGSLESVAQNYVGQFFPTLFSQFASTIDDKKRSTKASANSTYKFGEQTLRSVMYKLPGLRQQLEVATDIWGNEKEQADNIIQRAYESFLAPYSTTKNITSNLDKEIKKVYNKTGETGVIPSVPYSYIKYKDETYRMSAEEYTKYKKTFGQNANKYLNNLIKSNAYKNASNDDKAKMINNTYDYAKAEANEEYFKGQKINYSSDTLKELNALKNIGINDRSLAEYISNKTLSSTISGDKKLTASEKHEQIANNLINSNLNDKQLAYLYSKYYSTDEKLNNLVELNIPIKEFIKLNSQDIESDYNSNTGKTINNSKKNKIINYINSLNLSIAQKAILIKSQYNSFDSYNNEIINYVNNLNKSVNDKKVLLKSIGFDNYDKDVINYINSQNITKKEKETKLKSLGFTIRDGRVYSK